MALRVAIVPHTHWDREWYLPFQSFRLRLVQVVDEVLDLLESDPSYSHFLLDGQMAAVDDYLAIRPATEDRIRRLVTSKRLTVGPWYALMDEFLASPETIVRNLQLGLRRAAAFGGGMEIGYLPDMFGHVAQMPQILRSAGFEHAVVWRGVPSEITKAAFVWESPDGSAVRAQYLPFGYGNGALLPGTGASLVRRVENHLAQAGAFCVGDLLLMNGSDHLPPQSHVGRVVAEANAVQDHLHFEITSLPGYLSDTNTDGLVRWRGELRSGARANMLMGVASTRVDVKRAAGRAERALERRAEPYASLFQRPEDWPGALLDLAWLEIVRNSAHDSICACSVDAVVRAVLHRFDDAQAIAEGIASQALDALARSISAPGPLVVNPSARARGGIVELLVTGADETADGALAPSRTQLVAEQAQFPDHLALDAGTVRTILATIDGARIGADAWVQDVHVEEDETGIDVTVTVGPHELPGFGVAAAREDLAARCEARPEAPVQVHLVQPRVRRILARVEEVPGFGWAPAVAGGLAHPVTTSEEGTVRVTNGLVTVTVTSRTGTFGIGQHSGMGRIVDGGDVGDSYNYSPPTTDRSVERPDSVEVVTLETGPVRARVAVTAHYVWPEHADLDTSQRVGAVSAPVTTTIEVRANESAVWVTTVFVNPARDHRVRVHLPLPHPATCSEAGSAFAGATRGLKVEGRRDELGLPTFPARRFVRAGGLTVALGATCEYELVDIESTCETARTLALTALRATGMLSRLGMQYRPFPAGPLTPVEGLQMVGRTVELSYAVTTEEVDPWCFSEETLSPLEVVECAGGGWRGTRGSALELSGAEVSSVRRNGDVLEVRVFNPTTTTSRVDVGGRAGHLVDLRGSTLEHVDGSFALRAHGIATIELFDARAHQAPVDGTRHGLTHDAVGAPSAS